MSVANANKSMFYVYAPIERHALNTYKNAYLPDNTKEYKPRYREVLTIYEVTGVEVFNTEEVEYELKRIYDKSIIIDRT